MFWKRSRSLPDYCADMSEAMRRLDGAAAAEAHWAIVEQATKASPADLTEGLDNLEPALRSVAFGNGAMLARLCAWLIELGADPLVVLDTLIERVTVGLELAAEFPTVAKNLDYELPPPTGPWEAAGAIAQVVEAAELVDIDAAQAEQIAQAWFTVNDWIPALLVPMQLKHARKALPDRSRIVRASTAMLDHAEDATWLLGLLLILDDEPAIVVHRATGQVYAVSFSGIADNYQLYTLVGATLGQFTLADAHGDWIWHQGRPIGIPIVDGKRVIVLDPPRNRRGWNSGPAYPLLVPDFRVDRVLPPQEAAVWSARVRST